MKKLRSILLIAFAGLLLSSTLGFSVSRHYCMGMMVEESFFHLADRCGTEKDDHCEDTSHIKKDCCEDETISIPGLEIVSLTKEKILPGPQSVAGPACIIHLFSRAAERPQLSIPSHSPPAPPLSGRQILIAVQRFLI